MKYKTQHDIPYLKFLEFSEQIKDHTEDTLFIADKVIELFYPEITENESMYVEEFSIALKKEPKRFVKYRVDLKQLEETDKFIDADTFNHERDFKSLLKMIAKPLIPFTKLDVDKISLYDGQRVMQSFLQEQNKSSNLFNISLTRLLKLQMVR